MKFINTLKKCVSFKHNEGFYLVFVEVDLSGKVKNDRKAVGLNHIAFSVASNEILDLFYEKLRSQPVKILKKDEKQLCFEECNQFAVELFVK
ncbi:MAG: hypothetical protein VX642_07815 [Bdellovibrionota bacterium]|nr:hypothetical protein [Bdellovibrionota bacterium]